MWCISVGETSKWIYLWCIHDTYKHVYICKEEWNTEMWCNSVTKTFKWIMWCIDDTYKHRKHLKYR